MRVKHVGTDHQAGMQANMVRMIRFREPTVLAVATVGETRCLLQYFGSRLLSNYRAITSS